MTDGIQLRQQIQQARAHIEKGEWGKARKILVGIDHPKAAQLLAEVEGKLAEMPSSAGFPLIPVLGLVGIALLLALAGFWFFARSNTLDTIPIIETLPTLIPTDDCTPETVQQWWSVQNTSLDEFVRLSSLASRTMPGERLNQIMAALDAFGADFPDPPPCASAEVVQGVADLHAAMDQTLVALDDWVSDGAVSDVGLIPAAEIAFNRARDALRSAVNPV
jgi:hypothetical protein